LLKHPIHALGQPIDAVCEAFDGAHDLRGLLLPRQSGKRCGSAFGPYCFYMAFDLFPETKQKSEQHHDEANNAHDFRSGHASGLLRLNIVNMPLFVRLTSLLI